MRSLVLFLALLVCSNSKFQDRYARIGRSEGSGLTCSSLHKATPARDLLVVSLDAGLTDLVQLLLGSHGGQREPRQLNLEPGGLLSAELPVVVTKVLAPPLGPRRRTKHEVSAGAGIRRAGPGAGLGGGLAAGPGAGLGAGAAVAVGGFGAGVSSGGQGAGHGSWAATMEVS